MKELVLLLFAFISSVAFAQQPVTHTVTVNPDGSFSPRRIQIHDGDTVEWRFHDRTDAIIPVDSSGPPAKPVFGLQTVRSRRPE